MGKSTAFLFRAGTKRVSCTGMDEKPPKGNPPLALRIRQAIKLSGRSQADIARDLGVTPQSLTRWVGGGYIDKQRIPAFCRACGVDVGWLVTGEGEPRTSDPLRGLSPERIVEVLQAHMTRDELAELIRELVSAVARPPDEST